MKKIVHILYASLLATGFMYIGGCSSPPKPVTPSGDNRTQANDPERMQALQAKFAQDRQLMEENALLRKNLDEMKSKVTELGAVLRQALEVQKIPREKPEEKPPVAPSVKPLSVAPAVTDLPSYAMMQTPRGTVIRVFHKFNKTDFTPDQQTQAVLKKYIGSAVSIEVRGYTDGQQATKGETIVANLRAQNAKNWLVVNGVKENIISTTAHPAGSNLTENKTPQGRALNRRVEVDIVQDETTKIASS